MKRELPKILVVGTRATLSPLFVRLEETGRYHFTYAADPETAPLFLPSQPSVVVLHVPTEKEAAENALAFLETLRDQVPVVVMSTAADMGLYLAAMTPGGFDYFTSYTPLEEVRRVLDNAIRWWQSQAA